jgi:pimeloyl-ACP methyl ester carboxylesterase
VGNNRGNKISRHEEDHSAEFWEYCFDHLIQYDQPAVINGVLRETGKEKLIYIGHSQGSAQFLLGLGLNPDLQHKIAVFVGLGTVLSFEHVNSHVVM